MNDDSVADTILQARSFVARLGEQDAYQWWDDRALTPPGDYVLRRLFPRTAPMAMVELAMEAAAARHRALIVQPSRLMLFRLPPHLEARIEERWSELKRNSTADHFSHLFAPVDRPASLRDTLLNAGVTDEASLDAAAAATPSAVALPLGTATLAELGRPRDVRRHVRTLVAGYARSTVGRLLPPVLDLAAPS